MLCPWVAACFVAISFNHHAFSLTPVRPSEGCVLFGRPTEHYAFALKPLQDVLAALGSETIR